MLPTVICWLLFRSRCGAEASLSKRWVRTQKQSKWRFHFPTFTLPEWNWKNECFLHKGLSTSHADNQGRNPLSATQTAAQPIFLAAFCCHYKSSPDTERLQEQSSECGMCFWRWRTLHQRYRTLSAEAIGQSAWNHPLSAICTNSGPITTGKDNTKRAF